MKKLKSNVIFEGAKSEMIQENRKELQRKFNFGTVNPYTPSSTSRQPAPLILGVARLLNEDEVLARGKTYRKRVLRCQRTSSEASLRRFFSPGGRQARGFHLCNLIQASMRSRLGSSSSQWPALRSAPRRSPTTCSSVIRESS
jgi:hypothetical protein